MTLQTRADARHFLYNHSVVGPALGMYGTGNLATGYLSDVKFGNANYGANHFAGQATIILPGKTGHEQQKEAGEIVPDAPLPRLLHTDANPWVPEVGVPWELLFGGRGEGQITWDQLNAAAKRALRRCDGTRWLPVGPWRDALGRDNSDFGYGVAEWTASGAGLSISLSADRAHNDTGATSMLLTATQAGRYAHHTIGIPVQPRQRFWLAMLPIIVQGGPVTFQVWDYTGNAWVAQINETITLTGPGSHLHCGLSYEVPDNCYLLNARIGVANGGIAAIDALPGHGLHWRNWKTPDAMDEGYKLDALVEARYDSTPVQYVEDARSRRPLALRLKTDYIPQNTRGESSPNSIQWVKDGGLPAADLWYVAKYPASSRVNFDDDSEIADLNEDQYCASLLIEAAQMLEARDRLGRNGKWAELEAENLAKFAVETIAIEPVTPSVTPTRIWMGR